MSRRGWGVAAVGSAAISLVLLAWLDATYLTQAQRESVATFNSRGLSFVLTVVSLAVAGAALVVAFTTWRSRSVLVGAAIAVVGAFFAFLPVIWGFAAGVDGAPPAWLEPLRTPINQIFDATFGPRFAVGTLGAAMLLVGLATVARGLRARSTDPAP